MRKMILVLALLVMTVLLAGMGAAVMGLPSKVCFPLSTGAVCFNGTSVTGVSIPGDGNNYPTSLSVAGGAVKTITLGRDGLADLTANFNDADTTYTSGNGLVLSGTTFSLNTTYTGSLYYPLIGNPSGFLTSFTESDPVFTANNATIYSFITGRVLNSTLGSYYTKSEIDNSQSSQNTTISAKAFPGNCPSGQVVQNTTTSGVQCVTPSASAESDPVFVSNNASIYTAISGRVLNATLSNYYTKTEVDNSQSTQNSTISNINSAMLSNVSTRVLNSTLSNYYTKSEFDNSQSTQNSTISNVNSAMLSNVSTRVLNSTLSSYYTKSEVDASQLSQNTTISTKLTATAASCGAGEYSYFNGTGFPCRADQVGEAGTADGNNYTESIGFERTGNTVQLNLDIVGRSNLTATFTDTNTTYTNGSYLSLVGTTFSHTDNTTATSSDNSGRTYLQDVLIDAWGHITGFTTASETVTDTDDQTCAEVSGCVVGAITDGNTNWDNTYNFITNATRNTSATDLEGIDFGTMTGTKWCVYDSVGTEVDCNVEPLANGSGLNLTGTTIGHYDPSTVSNSDNGGNTFIQDLSFDIFGHVTNLITATVIEADPIFTANNATIYTAITGRVLNATLGNYYTKTEADTTNNAQNTTISQKALPGTCTGDQVVQNTTTAGVQCKTVTASSDGNNYPTGLSFAGAILTLTRNGLGDLTATIPDNSIKLDHTNITSAPWIKNATSASLTNVNITGTNECLYLPGGGKACGNTTCTWIISPNGGTVMRTCN